MINFFHSTIGKKSIVAITGLVMFGFVIGHLLGNLQVFVSADKLNAYAAFLKETKPLLWGTRLGLLLSVALHIVCTVQLNRRNRSSRPVAYQEHDLIQATLPSRFMIWSGAFLGFYVVYHLLHLTVGRVHPSFSHTDVYGNLVSAFQNPMVSTVYILAMVSLGFHLNHGIFSVFQTLGLNHPKYNLLRKIFAVGASVVIAVGYISIPVAVMAGWVR
ncbi:MAG: hypothetical protein KCHDKBKB_01906 [Elusimicrobia bacterium]|nr:hypothetical protein [Elusimicrobiota bacterium]